MCNRVWKYERFWNIIIQKYNTECGKRRASAGCDYQYMTITMTNWTWFPCFIEWYLFNGVLVDLVCDEKHEAGAELLLLVLWLLYVGIRRQHRSKRAANYQGTVIWNPLRYVMMRMSMTMSVTLTQPIEIIIKRDTFWRYVIWIYYFVPGIPIINQNAL